MLVFGGPTHARAVLSRLKHHYGPREAELVRYFNRGGGREGAAEVLLRCERRLENVVRRAGFTRNRADARRAVVHGHILINGRKTTHPGYLVRAGDMLTVRPRPHIEALYRNQLGAEVPPGWLTIDPPALRVTVARLPAVSDVAVAVDPAEIVELLSN
jgi:small subunit ribosomal protein S4